MKVAGAFTIVYSVLVGLSGTLAWLRGGSLLFLILVLCAAAALLTSSVGIWRGWLPAAFIACATAMLLGLFFGYLFIASGNFLPGGVMLISSFLILFVILLALFVRLAQHSSHP